MAENSDKLLLVLDIRAKAIRINTTTIKSHEDVNVLVEALYVCAAQLWPEEQDEQDDN